MDPTLRERLNSSARLSQLNIYVRVAKKVIPKLEQLREGSNLQEAVVHDMTEYNEVVGQVRTLGELYDSTIRLFQELHTKASSLRQETLAAKLLFSKSGCEALQPLAHQCSVSLALIKQCDEKAKSTELPLCEPIIIW